MKTLRFIIVPFLFMITSCNGQDKKGTGHSLSLLAPAVKTGDSLAKPNIRYKVNKKYDSMGNVISYDSTYSYSYSGPAGAGLMLKPETFNGGFSTDPNSFPPGLFKSPGLNFSDRDTTFLNPFDNNYFQKQMEMSRKLMDELLRQFKTMPPPAIHDAERRQAGQKTI